ncbi:MAG: hypothetical protein AAFN78_05580 [Pseudomonadota bacterium]
MKKTLSSLFVIASLGASLVTSPAHAEEHQQTDSVTRLADGAPVGQAITIRTENRVQSVVRTTDLDPGSAVSVWWRIYNHPKHCAMPYACTASDLENPLVKGSQLQATALQVSESDGAAIISATIYRTAAKAADGQGFDSSLVEGYLSGPGLRRPLDAAIQLELVSHGRIADPAIDGEEAAMAQLLTPSATQLDCTDDESTAAGRRFRCGGLQRVDIVPRVHN